LQIRFNGLQLGDVLGLRPTVTFFNLKAHPVTFIERSEPWHIDRRMVNKQILTIFLLNKSKPFSFTEPLHYSFSQSVDLLSQVLYGPKPKVATLAMKNNPSE
jgi:hypothetical protein